MLYTTSMLRFSAAILLFALCSTIASTSLSVARFIDTHQTYWFIVTAIDTFMLGALITRAIYLFLFEV